MLLLVDVKEVDVILKMFLETISWRLIFLSFPFIVLVLGTSYFNTNVYVTKKHIKYKELLKFIEEETFKKCNSFVNDDFSYSHNWIFLDDCLIPIFMVDKIKIRQGEKFKICLLLSDGSEFIYAPKDRNKIILEMAKKIEETINELKEKDCKQLFELKEKKKSTKILSIVSFVISILDFLAFLIARVIILYDTDMRNSFNIAFIIIALINEIFDIALLKKKQDIGYTKWALGISIYTVILILTYMACSFYVYDTLGVRY